MAGISEDKLNQLAGDLGNHDNLGTLGLKLGFKKVKVSQFLATNHVGGAVGCTGTTNMLFAWKNKTPKAQQIPNLRQALIDAELAEVAEDLSEGGNAL